MYMRMRTKCWYSGKPVRPRKDDRTNLNLRKDICHKRHSTVSQIRDGICQRGKKKDAHANLHAFIYKRLTRVN